MSKKLRITLFIDEDSMPELYQELVNIPPRARAVRCRNLAMSGLLLVRGNIPLVRESPKMELEDDMEEERSAKREKMRKTVKKLLSSTD
ncbi:hypothetical protein [Methylohalobius crimeensis]|uniref:hypothetical protein n=1 Tax=Methylohalobius crimeensis TaxID=244365 RepID=UPI0003B62EB4|nr:hypothetical protein [Methylohalobius crimeensis]